MTSSCKEYLRRLKDRSAGADLPEEKRPERLRKKKENKPRFDLRAELFRMTGTDLTRIDGIDVRTAPTGHQRSRMGHEQVAGRRPFCFWAAVVPPITELAETELLEEVDCQRTTH